MVRNTTKMCVRVLVRNAVGAVNAATMGAVGWQDTFTWDDTDTWDDSGTIGNP